jgi:hypothetical protein
LSHILRAAGVVGGEVAPAPVTAVGGTGAYQTVPAGLIRNNCWHYNSQRSAACAVRPNGDKTPVRVATAAGRYNPVYYAVVGAPIKFWPNMKGVLLSRLISAALSAALLAVAMVSVVRFSRRRLMLGGLLLAATPMAIEMASAINPNGVEIAAGIAFFASAVPILLGRARERPPTWLVCVTVISAVVLVTVRSGGPVWIALSAAALLLPMRWTAARDLLRVRSLRWGTVVIAVAGVASMLWIVLMKASQLATVQGQEILKPGEIQLMELQRWPVLIQEMVGVFGWLDTHMWAPAYLAWQYPAAALLLVALVAGTWTDRWRLLVVVVGSVVLSAAVEMQGANKYGGFIGQGRYLLPLLAGALILAAWIVEERGLATEHCRRLTRLIVVITLPIQLHGLWVAMVRYQSGIPPHAGPADYNPLVGSWHPQVGSVAPLAMVVLGLGVLGWLGWRSAALPSSFPDDASLVVHESRLASPAPASGV